MCGQIFKYSVHHIWCGMKMWGSTRAHVPCCPKIGKCLFKQPSSGHLRCSACIPCPQSLRVLPLGCPHVWGHHPCRIGSLEAECVCSLMQPAPRAPVKLKDQSCLSNTLAGQNYPCALTNSSGWESVSRADGWISSHVAIYLHLQIPPSLIREGRGRENLIKAAP